MKVTLFNHWFKYKVSIDDIWDSTLRDKVGSRPLTVGRGNFWNWLNDTYDVGQYYNWQEEQNYLVFHNEHHYTMFLLKL